MAAGSSRRPLTSASKKPLAKRKGYGFISAGLPAIALAVSQSMSRREMSRSNPPPQASGSSMGIAEEAALRGIQPSHVADALEPTADDLDWVDIEDGQEQEQPSIIIDLARIGRYSRKRATTRTRRQISDVRAGQWEALLPELVPAYLELKRRRADALDGDTEPPSPECISFSIIAMDLLEKPEPRLFVRKHANEHAVSTLMRYGYMACTPAEPALAIGIHTLELFHQLRRYHPRLGFQAFARAMCAFERVRYRPAFRQQLSEAFDAYLLLLRHVDQHVKSFLGQASPGWRVQNSCPPCTYKLDDEPELPAGRLWAMDGNGSLKRHANAGSANARVFNSDYSLGAAKVDVYKDEVRRQAAPATRHALVSGATPGEGEESEIPCVNNWKNLQPEHMKTALEQFEQTGVFVSACRHAFILHCSEMIRSGELAKYGLAHTAEMLALDRGRNQRPGYDIGCGFETTVRNSCLGPTAREKGLKFVVGAFHGHAHNRLCQLTWHPLTFTGVGLEDFETCERIYFESNDVGRGVRYATLYHYRQAIDLHWRHWDKMRYEELSRWLVNKYESAIKVLRDSNDALAAAAHLGFGPEEYTVWLSEEREYLQSLKEEPEEDVLSIGYVQALQVLHDARKKLNASSVDISALNLTAGDFESGGATLNSVSKRLASAERNRRHAQETYMAALSAVQDYERRLDIGADQRWDATTPAWQRTVAYIRERSVRQALDHLELLVVQRLLELTKANMSGVCYKMRVHIAKALKTRSAAIRNALDKYNDAARKLDPSAEPLVWEDVADWTELQDFTLLRCARTDVRARPWAVPTNRLLMNSYFKSLRAQEEIQRLNVEVRRLRTYVDDNDRELADAVSRARDEGNPLLVELEEIRTYRARVNGVHRARLDELAARPIFSGVPGPGTRNGDANMREAPNRTPEVDTTLEDAQQDDDDESDSEHFGAQADILEDFMQNVARDTHGEPLAPASFVWNLHN